ncbi:MAG: hypothetical protein AMXMBFR82_35150 [Candidatus Hydrogenedentota bacterium]
MFPVPWLPTPMHPMTIRLLGATDAPRPSADDGIIIGAATAALVAAAVRLRKSRRLSAEASAPL